MKGPLCAASQLGTRGGERKTDDKYLRVQSKANSIVRKEIVPLSDKLRLGALFRDPGSPDKDIRVPRYWVLPKDSYRMGARELKRSDNGSFS